MLLERVCIDSDAITFKMVYVYAHVLCCKPKSCFLQQTQWYQTILLSELKVYISLVHKKW